MRFSALGIRMELGSVLQCRQLRDAWKFTGTGGTILESALPDVAFYMARATSTLFWGSGMKRTWYELPACRRAVWERGVLKAVPLLPNAWAMCPIPQTEAIENEERTAGEAEISNTHC